MSNALLAIVLAMVFGLSFEVGAQEDKRPPALLEIWVVNNKAGKTLYLWQGESNKVKTLAECLAELKKKADAERTVVMVKVGRDVQLTPIKSLYEGVEKVGVKRLGLFVLTGLYSENETVSKEEAMRIRDWAKKAKATFVEMEATDDEILETVEVEDVIEDEEDPGVHEILEVVEPSTDNYDGATALTKRGLGWLSKVQNPSGSWGKGDGFAEKNGDPESTALALLAFLADGHTPLSERYGKAVQDAMKWIGEYGMNETLGGRIKSKKAARRHAIVTIALAESYNMTRIPFIQASMEASAKVIVDGQQFNGGFNAIYEKTKEWDTTVTAWNALAMTTAKRAGCQAEGLGGAIEKTRIFLEKTAYLEKGKFVTSYAKKPADDNLNGLCTFVLAHLGSVDSEPVKLAFKKGTADKRKALQMVETTPKNWMADVEKQVPGWCFHTYLLAGRGENDPAYQAWCRELEARAKRTMHKHGYWDAKDGDVGRIPNTALMLLALGAKMRYVTLSGPPKKQWRPRP